MRYTIVLDPDVEEGGYTVTVPALPGVVTQGETVDPSADLHIRRFVSLPASRNRTCLQVCGLRCPGVPNT